jgi:hypothetical protein
MGLQNATVVYKIEFSPNNLEDRNSYDMTLINGSLLILPDHKNFIVRDCLANYRADSIQILE